MPKLFFEIYHVFPFTVKFFAQPGTNVTLPCVLLTKDTMQFGVVGSRIKWTKVGGDESLNEDVLLSMGPHKSTYGTFKNRAFLTTEDSEDASITITDVSIEDSGKYRCEIINGISEIVQEIILMVQDLGIYA